MNNTMIRFTVFLFLTIISTALYSQMEVTNAAPITPENLISNVFLGDGVEVISIDYEGDARAVGLFTNALDDIGMSRGIVMTTGAAVSQGAQIGVNAPGISQASQSNSSSAQDVDLQTIVGNGTSINDVSKYTIQFIPTNDTLQFTYAFASEEYPEYVCSDFNDVFGFFISGPGITGPYQNAGENIALIPGTNRPVTINNVNPGVVGEQGMLQNCQGANGSLAFSQYFNGNETTSLPVYDGYTDVFIAQAVVMPCSVYTIKLVIGDVGDSGWDSGVFLEAKSFGTGSLEVEIDGLAVDGGLAEGCSQGEITFALPGPVESPYDVAFEVGGTATPGVDYPTLPSEIIIPAGDSTFSISIFAFEDNIIENDETIIISVQRDPCNRDTFTILVKDNILIKPDLGPDLTTCPSDETQLDGTSAVPLPDPPHFENNTPLVIDQINTPFVSEIEVIGVLPLELGPEAILSICIDSLEHRWIDDLDIFLLTPGGQFLELTTDNGADGGNGLGIDNYLNTCFTVDATTLISFPGPVAPATAVPFTGNWLPEGVWSDLWDGDNPTNGTWQLVITDDTQGINGTLFSWSITFNAIYDIAYSWSPVEGLSCSNCPDPIASPDVSTTYILTAMDSYGCIKEDTINFEVLPALQMSELMCGLSTVSSVQVSWTDVIGTTGYEVSVNGGPWEPANDVLAHNVNGLGVSEDVEIIVRGIAECPTFPDTITCTTLDCTPATLSATLTQVSCFSGMDGSVQVDTENGTPPFSYELAGEINNTGLFSDLAAATYTVMVTDGNACIGSIEFEIEEPVSPIFTNIVEQPLNCNGDMNGALTVAVENPNSPYLFNWSNGTADSIATNLAAGDYSLQLTDAAACVYDLNFTLEEPTLLEATIDALDANCAASSTGQAWVTVTGGTGAYTYLWNDGQTQDTAFSLPAALYEVQVTDSLNCSLSINVNVDEPDVLSLVNPITSPALCNGDATGSASIEIVGGTMPYEINWVQQLTGDVLSNQMMAADLPAGDYEVLVTDANGCTQSLGLTVAEPAILELFNLQTNSPSCVGLADGTGLIDVQGGTQPYTVSWNDGSIGMSSNNLTSNNHWVAVQDANACTDTLFFEVAPPPAIEVSLSADSVSCFGFSDGSALVEVQGGMIPYTYLWSNNTTAALAENLPAGIHTIEVWDANNCLTQAMVEVLSPVLLEVNLSAVDPTCFGGDNGQATATPTGGTPPYSYAWSDGQTTENASALTAQPISVIVTDAKNCTAIASITLGEPNLLTATTSAQEQACASVNGQAVVNPTGGISPYTYLWNNGQTGQTATALQAGDYTVTVTDAQACTFITTVNVPMAETVSITNFELTHVSCYAGNDGEVTVTLTGGTAPFTWSESLTALQAGAYSLTVTDNNACTDVLDILIEQPAELIPSASITHVTCTGEQTGALDITVSGGSLPYNYAWNTGAITEDISNLLSGNYTLSVTDAQGCISVLETTVNEATALSMLNEFTNVACFGLATGSISIAGRGGEAPYSFVWSNGDTGAEQNTLAAGDYTVTMTDTYNCEIIQTITITQPDVILATFTSQDVTCFGGRDGIMKIEGAGGVPPYRYRYNNDPWQSGGTFIAIRAGAYTLHMEDANGCPYNIGQAIINEPSEITIDMGGDQEMRFGDSMRIVPIVSSQNPIVSYQWLNYDSTWMSCEDCQQQFIFPDYTRDLFLLVKDENGCTAEEWIRIRVSKDFPVSVPTGFTPNGDFTNDLLRVHGLPGIKILSFQVWNRWGEMMYEQGGFETNDPFVGWDGAFRGQTMNSGVYVWKLEVEFPDGKTEQMAGQTTLIR